MKWSYDEIHEINHRRCTIVTMTLVYLWIGPHGSFTQLSVTKHCQEHSSDNTLTLTSGLFFHLQPHSWWQLSKLIWCNLMFLLLWNLAIGFHWTGLNSVLFRVLFYIQIVSFFASSYGMTTTTYIVEIFCEDFWGRASCHYKYLFQNRQRKKTKGQAADWCSCGKCLGVVVEVVYTTCSSSSSRNSNLPWI